MEINKIQCGALAIVSKLSIKFCLKKKKGRQLLYWCHDPGYACGGGEGGDPRCSDSQNSLNCLYLATFLIEP